MSAPVSALAPGLGRQQIVVPDDGLNRQINYREYILNGKCGGSGKKTGDGDGDEDASVLERWQNVEALMDMAAQHAKSGWRNLHIGPVVRYPPIHPRQTQLGPEMLMSRMLATPVHGDTLPVYGAVCPSSICQRLATGAQAQVDGVTTLLHFLADCALMSSEVKVGTDSPADAVQLATLHASKGLEFHTVCLIGESSNFDDAVNILRSGLCQHEVAAWSVQQIWHATRQPTPNWVFNLPTADPRHPHDCNHTLWLTSPADTGTTNAT